jgi:hypothetical protein
VNPHQQRLRLTVEGIGLSVGLDLLSDQNPHTCEAVLGALPLNSIVGHVVVSGGGLWIPTRLTYLGPRASVRRRPGSVYFYPPMQSVCITYGAISESAHVNEFARVRDEDLATLEVIGRHVWDTTIVDPRRRTVRIGITATADEGTVAA